MTGKLLRGWLLAGCLVAPSAAWAQSLEETVLVLERAGALSTVTRQDSNTVIAGGRIDWEVRVVEPSACVVRITDRERKPYTEIRSDWGTGPMIRSENLGAIYQELYLGRVVAADIRKVPEVLGTRNGVVVEQLPDAKWRLAGSPGDEVRCVFSPDKTKACWDHVEFSRLLPVKGLADQDERTGRVDRALVHLYSDLCKGSPKRVPF